MVGKVFFFERCPPPEHGAAACQLTGYLTDPDQTQLDAGDLNEAILLAENGAVVTCTEHEAVDLACPGWRHATGYRLLGVVEHQVRGGRETQQVQLNVSSKDVI